MAELTKDEFDAANEAGRVEFETKPHAAGARYDRRTGLMTLDLYNGTSFTFPVRELQGMANASDQQIEGFDLGLTGYGLHWEELDADFSVPGLLAGHFGTARYMESKRASLRRTYEQVIGPQEGWNAQAAE